MVSYYPPMYRHHQATVPNTGTPQFPNSATMHPWYAGYHQGGGQMGASTSASYCMQDEQQFWHTHSHPHSVFSEFNDFGGGPHIPPMGLQQVQENQEHNLPASSPVSGSDMSSPGASGNPSPQNPTPGGSRPTQARSPYEWIKKTSYAVQTNQPGKTRTKDKYRVVYTDHQRVELEKEFYYSRYITIRRKAELANNLGLSERQVKIWFQNRRAKERKQVKKREEFSHKDNTSSINSMAHMTQPHMIHDAQLGQGVMTAPTLI